MPATSCATERSFSTLRRVKTWLRSTTGEDRLNGLCMLSVNRERVNIRKDKLIEQLITRFAREQPRDFSFYLITNKQHVILTHFLGCKEYIF